MNLKFKFIIILFSCMSFFSYANSDIYDLNFSGIDGNNIPLENFKNKPLLIVNTASLCGFTYQYEELQNLYDKFKTKGLTIIGIPSNDFGNQELKSNKKVKEFCELNFRISFPMTTITKVRGENKHPFFKWIYENGGPISTPKWNFYKYLIDKNGNLSSWFSSVTKPSSTKFMKALNKIL